MYMTKILALLGQTFDFEALAGVGCSMQLLLIWIHCVDEKVLILIRIYYGFEKGSEL